MSVADSLVERAETLGRLGRRSEGEPLLQEALALEPEHVGALLGLARVRSDEHRADDACDLARRAVHLDPEGLNTLAEAAMILGTHDQLDESLPLVVRLTELYPEFWFGHYLHAKTLRSLPRPRSRDAYDHARRAVELSPHESAAHNMVGICLDDLGMHDEAARAYQRAVELEPENTSALNNLGASRAQSGRLFEASRLVSSGLGQDAQSEMLQHNYDVVLGRLLYYLWALLIIGSLALGGLLIADVPPIARYITAGAGVAGIVGLVWWVTRKLPSGAGQVLRTMRRRQGFVSLWNWMALLVMTLLFLVVAFADRDTALQATRSVLRIAVVGVVLATVSALWSARRDS